ncbi:MAG: hypothetical protein V3V67_19185 [Myxococcota bacterium]
MVASRPATAYSLAVSLASLALCAFLIACASTPGSPPEADAASSGSVAPLVARAERAMQIGDYDAAIAGYSKAFEATPWNARLERALVAAYAARAAHPQTGGLAGLRASESDLRTALGIAPDVPALKQSLAAVLIDLSALEPDRARAALLREEARSYAPELESQTPAVHLRVERRLDMAFELIERGQLDAGIDRLQRLHEEYPDRADAARLLAQARVRKGTELAALRDHGNAGASFDQAVELYERLAPCDGSRCDERELRMAHRNRIIAWVSASRFEEARHALDDAERAGLSFPALRAELQGQGGGR